MKPLSILSSISPPSFCLWMWYMPVCRRACVWYGYGGLKSISCVFLDFYPHYWGRFFIYIYLPFQRVYIANLLLGNLFKVLALQEGQSLPGFYIISGTSSSVHLVSSDVCPCFLINSIFFKVNFWMALAKSLDFLSFSASSSLFLCVFFYQNVRADEATRTLVI